MEGWAIQVEVRHGSFICSVGGQISGESHPMLTMVMVTEGGVGIGNIKDS